MGLGLPGLWVMGIPRLWVMGIPRLWVMAYRLKKLKSSYMGCFLADFKK